MKTLEDTSIVELWSCNDSDEVITAESRDEAIENYLDVIDPEDEPETLECFGYARKKVTEKDINAMWLVEQVLEELDEEYGCPFEDTDQNTERLLYAAREFAREAARIYVPWACEIVHQETVNLKRWKEDVGYGKDD